MSKFALVPAADKLCVVLFYLSVRITCQQPLRDLGELPATLVLDRRIENPHDVESVIRPFGGYRRLRFVARHQVSCDLDDRLVLPRNQNDTALSQDLLRQSSLLPFTKIQNGRDSQFLCERCDGLQGTLAFTRFVLLQRHTGMARGGGVDRNGPIEGAVGSR